MAGTRSVTKRMPNKIMVRVSVATRARLYKLILLVRPGLKKRLFLNKGGCILYVGQLESRAFACKASGLLGSMVKAFSKALRASLLLPLLSYKDPASR